MSLRLAEPELDALRTELRAWLGDMGVEDEVREDIVLACWEAATNALEHSVGSDGTVHVVAEQHEGHIVVCVTDNGAWRRRDHPDEDRGIGLQLIDATMDAVRVVSNDDGTRVLMCRCLSPAAHTLSPAAHT